MIIHVIRYVITSWYNVVLMYFSLENVWEKEINLVLHCFIYVTNVLENHFVI